LAHEKNKMINSKKDFSKVFQSKFVEKLKDSLIPNNRFDKNQIIDELYSDIMNYTYSPQKPRGYIILNKHNYVSRICPTFYPKDYFLFFYCCKMLEDDIAINRVEGTYGGWTLGNPIKEIEHSEQLELEVSIPLNSYNPYLWQKNWKEFQKIAYNYARQDEYKHFIKLDLANFYNRINLDLLKKQILLVVPKEKQNIVELLFCFLEGWNKIIEGFGRKTIGIPQDEISDCSRLLSNFYLQDYDLEISEFAKNNNCKYIRYADDQIIYANNKENAIKVLFHASKILNKYALDLNSGKVHQYSNREEFNRYWAFEIFDCLENIDNEVLVRRGIDLFFTWSKEKIDFRKDGVIKRLFNLNLKYLTTLERKEIFEDALNKDFLSNTDYWWMNKIYNILDDDSKRDFLKILNELIEEVIFNSYHYNLMKFYKKNHIIYDEKHLSERILEISII